MANTLNQDGNGFWAQQDKDAFLDYALDWSDWLADGDTLVNSSWATDAALTLNSQALDGTYTSVWVQGGVANTWYAVTNTVISAQGRRDQRTIRLFITDDAAAVAANDGTPIFPNRINAIDEIKRDQLMVAGKNFLAGIELSDDYIFEKLRAAESSVQHAVRCYLTPTVIIPDDAPQSEIDALELAGTRYAQEAAYDYESNFFAADRWGYIVTLQKPLISVQSIKFVYPSPLGQIFQIPAEWIRLDKKYGHIRIVPSALSASVPMAALIMQSISGGMTVPMMIHVRYTAGIKDIRKEYPDLLMAIKRTAVLDIIKDSFAPQSGSISADGLSQSMSADLDKYQDSVSKTIATIRDSIHGVRFAVF